MIFLIMMDLEGLNPHQVAPLRSTCTAAASVRLAVRFWCSFFLHEGRRQTKCCLHLSDLKTATKKGIYSGTVQTVHGNISNVLTQRSTRLGEASYTKLVCWCHVCLLPSPTEGNTVFQQPVVFSIKTMLSFQS